jgi:O-antigen/teichoic acid export membrane protein
MRRSLLSLLSDTAVYGLGRVLSRLLNFLLLPLYLVYLEPAEFGIVALLAICITVFEPLASAGMPSALYRRFNVTKDRTEREAVFSTACVTSTVATGGLFLLGFALAPAIARLMIDDASAESVTLVELTLATAALNALAAAPRAVLRGLRRARLVAGLSLGTAVVIGATTLTLLALGYGAKGAVLGLLCGTAVQTAVAVAVTLPWFRPRLGYKTLSEMVRYGLPFVPHDLISAALASVGQYVVGARLGLVEAGHYSIASRFALPVGLAVNALVTAWGPFKFEVHATHEKPKDFFRSVTTYYAAAVGMFWVLITFAGREFILLATEPRYHPAAGLVSVLAGAHVVRGLYSLFSSGFELGSDTRSLPLVSALGLAVTAPAALLAAEYWGAFGVGLSMVLGVSVMTTAIHGLAKRRIEIPYAWNLLLLLLLLVLACLGALELGRSLDTRWRVVSGFLVCVAYPLMAYRVLMSNKIERGRLERARAGLVKRLREGLAPNTH